MSASKWLGMALGIGEKLFDNNAQEKMAEHNTRLQIEAQKELSDYNKQNSLDIWNETSFRYDKQMENLKKAGLNPGLIYGMGGAGGGTPATSQPGSVSGQSNQVKGGQAMAGLAIGTQLAQAEANKELIEAQTEKTKAETEKIGGVDTEESKTRINNLLQGIENAKAQEQIQKVEGRLKEIEESEAKISHEDRMDFIEYQTKRALTDLENARNETFISSATINEKVKIIQEEAIGAGLRNELIKSETILNEEQKNELKARINKMSEDIAQGWKNLDQNEKRNKIQEFAEEIKAEYPSIFNAGGKVVNDIVTFLEKIVGDGDRNNRRNVE